MHAALLHVLGGPPSHDVTAEPDPEPGRTVVRVVAAPVVPLDLLAASGTSYFGEPALPYVPGVQGVGLVEQSDVVPTGTRVWFTTPAGTAPGDGSWADLCSVGDGDLVPVTADVPDAHVAALGLSAVAAWMALSWRGRLQPGERVVVLGAGGAVGQAGIGAARALGASEVVAVCRPGASADRARAAGAALVVETDPDVAVLAGRLQEATHGAVDVVLDPVFGVPAAAASLVLAPGGRLVNLGGSASDQATFSSALLRSRSIDVVGYTNNALTAEQRAAALGAVLDHAARGSLRVAHQVCPLDEVAGAWRDVAGGSGERTVLLPG